MNNWHTPNDYDHPAQTGMIRTVSGKYIDLLSPQPESICVEDIAHALSFINRFGGHTATPYSVGEHSIGVSNMLMRSFGESRLALLGLLHDAAEAYLGDMVRPLKEQMEAYRSAETKMELVIARALIPPRGSEDLPRHQLVKSADRTIISFEMSVIRNATWRQPPDPVDIKKEFLRLYETLVKDS